MSLSKPSRRLMPLIFLPMLIVVLGNSSFVAGFITTVQGDGSTCVASSIDYYQPHTRKGFVPRTVSLASGTGCILDDRFTTASVAIVPGRPLYVFAKSGATTSIKSVITTVGSAPTSATGGTITAVKDDLLTVDGPDGVVQVTIPTEIRKEGDKADRTILTIGSYAMLFAARSQCVVALDPLPAPPELTADQKGSAEGIITAFTDQAETVTIDLDRGEKKETITLNLKSMRHPMFVCDGFRMDKTATIVVGRRVALGSYRSRGANSPTVIATSTSMSGKVVLINGRIVVLEVNGAQRPIILDADAKIVVGNKNASLDMLTPGRLVRIFPPRPAVLDITSVDPARKAGSDSKKGEREE